MKRRSFISVLLLGFCIVFPGSGAQAISVAPAIVDISVKAGSASDFSILVTNEESQTLSFALTIQKFLPQGEFGQTMFLPPEDTSGLPDWLFLEAPTVTLRSGESRRIPVSLRVPNGATPGGHYAAIFLTQTTLDTAAGQNVSAIPRIGVLVFATVDGALVEKATLKDVQIEQPDLSRLPVVVKATVENRGNIHIEPRISVEIKNVFGNVVKQLDANERNARILPSSSRVFATSWIKSAPLDGEAGFVQAFQEELRNFAIGWYEARVTVATDAGETGEMYVRFQVWPWRSMLVALVSVLTLLLILKAIRKSKR